MDRGGCGPRGRPTIVRVACAELPEIQEEKDDGPEELGRAVGEALRNLKFRPGAAVMAVPSSKQILRNLSVPPSPNLGETAAMVRFQAAKDLPFPAEEVAVDFLVRTEAAAIGPGSAPNIFAAALKKESVAASIALAQAAGFKLKGLGLRAVGAAAFCHACWPGRGSKTAVALITLGAEFVHTDVVRGKDLLFTRSTKLPVVANDEGAAKAVSIECVRALSGFSGASLSRGIECVWVGGATGLESRVAALLKDRLSLPCEELDPGVLLGLTGEMADAARGGAGALGLALAAADADGLRIDLLNPKKPAQPRDLGRLRLLAGLALAAGALLLLVALRTNMVKSRTAILKQIELEIAEGEKKRPIYRAMKQQAATLQEWNRGRRDWLDFYSHLTTVMPSSEDVYLTSLAVSGSSSIRLSVQARGGEVLSRLEKQLRAAGYEVKPMAIQPGSDRFGYDFRTTVELIVPDQLKLDWNKQKPPPRLADDASLEPGAIKGVRP